MTIYQRNNRRGHKFVLSGLLFGFSMARIVANIMRIVWAYRPHNARIAIAANIFTNAGVLLLFIVNLILVLRVLRAYHPQIGWSKPVRFSFRGLYAAVGACLIMVIISVVYGVYTLDAHIKSQLRDVQLTATVFLAVLSFLPLPILAFTLLLPRKQPLDHFGSKSMRTKIILIAFTSTLLCLGASFRAGTAFFLRPVNNPAWFHSKACYYCFNYTIEVIVIFTYALTRFDRRFHVPNGSSERATYALPEEFDTAAVSGSQVDEETLAHDEHKANENTWTEKLHDDARDSS